MKNLDINFKIIKTKEFEDIEIYEGKNKVGVISMNIFLIEDFKNIILKDFEKNTINKNDEISKSNLLLLKKEIINIKKVIYIEEIKIKKLFQNQGFGTKLLNFTLEKLKSNKDFKSKTLVYIVRAKIENIEEKILSNIYSKFGFSNSIIEKDSIRLFNNLENLYIYEKKHLIKNNFFNFN